MLMMNCWTSPHCSEAPLHWGPGAKLPCYPRPCPLSSVLFHIPTFIFHVLLTLTSNYINLINLIVHIWFCVSRKGGWDPPGWHVQVAVLAGCWISYLDVDWVGKFFLGSTNVAWKCYCHFVRASFLEVNLSGLEWVLSGQECWLLQVMIGCD